MAVRILPRSPLLRYLAVRLALIIPTVLILVTVVFFCMRVVGDPITAALGGRLSPDQLAARRTAAGFDRPILNQYLEYLGRLLHGDFGTALTDRRQISEVLVTNGAATLELTFWALIVAFAVGVPLGRLAARYRDRIGDVSIRVFAILVYAAPVFFLGLLLKLLFSSTLGWLPASGRAAPAVALELQHVTPRTNIMIVDAILYGDTDYVLAARARGVSEAKVVRKHAFRNALVPIVTVMGMQIAMMLGGAILTE